MAKFTIGQLEWNWTQLGDDRFALTCTDPEVTHENLENWPTDEEVSEHVGFVVSFLDGGDHPTLIEGIYTGEAAAQRVSVGDRVQTVGCADEDSDAGVIHEIRADGTALVGWDSGVVTPCDLDALERA